MLDTTGLTQFIANQNRTGAPLHVIVKLTDGTSTWYLSDTSMILTDGTVYPVLKHMTGIRSEADPLTKGWSVSDVMLDFINAPYMDNTTGRYQRLSDQIGGVVGRDIYIYLAAGIPTAISDCLLRFYGQVMDIRDYDAEGISLECTDKSNIWNKQIPTENYTQDDGYAYFPSTEVADTPVPITYGTFSFDKSRPWKGSGLMKGYPRTSSIWHSPMRFADHAIESLTAMYYKRGECPLVCENITTDLALADGTLDDDYVLVPLYPISNETAGYTGTLSDATVVYDGKAIDSVTSKDYYDTGGTQRFRAMLMIGEEYDYAASAAISSNAERSLDTDIVLYYKVGQNVTHDTRSVSLLHATPATALMTIASPTYDNTLRSSSSTVTPASARARSAVYVIEVYGQIAVSGDADGVTNNQNRATVDEAYATVKWLFSRSLYQGENPPETEAWAAGTGRAFGSWIDGAGRSNSFNSGDLIDGIGGTVESILRDELGLATANIDEDSFDANIYSLGANFAFQALERKPAFEYIKQLIEQSPLLFVFTANSKARLINLNDSTPTTQRTIPFSHIVADSLSITRKRPFANQATVKSRWNEFLDSFCDSTTWTNTASVTAHGYIRYNAEWPNIFGESGALPVDALIDFYVAAADGIWSQPHNHISFETVGFTNADLEVGDWIELEAASCDGQVKLFGETWASRQFMVTSVDQGQYTTRISAIELFEP